MKPASMKVLYAYLAKATPYLIAIVTFLIFKHFVPDPWFSRDSEDYINCAIRNNEVWYRPVGYSKLLQVFHSINLNYSAVILFQFFVFIISSGLLLEKIFLMYNAGMAFKIIAWCLTIYNPFALYLCNFLTTDSLFLSLTCIWFISLFNYLRAGNKYQFVWLIIHVAALYFLFSLRYNALYYPFVTLIAVIIYKTKMVSKVILAGFSILILAALVNKTKDITEKETGTRVLSGLGAWALANNAIHIYNVTDVDDDTWDFDEAKIIDKCIKLYKDSVYIPHNNKITDQYMWQKEGPLKRYAYYKLATGENQSYIVEWFALAPRYQKFALQLVKAYPLAYLKAFYLPNLKKCFVPDLEILNFRQSTVPVLTEDEKNYIKYPRYTYSYTETLIFITELMQNIFTILNILTAISSIIFIIQFIAYRGQKSDAQRLTFVLSAFFITTIFLMTFAHPVLIRYIAFNETFLTILPLILIHQHWSAITNKIRIFRSAPHKEA